MIIGAMGIVSKSLQKYLETIPGQHSVDSLQKTAILGASHIITKVLQAETWSLSGGAHHCVKRITREKKTCDKRRKKQQYRRRRVYKVFFATTRGQKQTYF
jgi:Co/Zn/Cd efflux system component